MKTKSFKGMACSVAAALEQVGDRWTLLLARNLLIGGPSRFDDLRSETGIPSATLSARLKEMTRHGLITQVQGGDSGPRGSYALTNKGRALWKIIFGLREWGDDWNANGLGKPSISLIHRESGDPIRLSVINQTTGSIVQADEILMVPGEAADDTTIVLLSKGMERRK